jgi:hypothetical protein
MNESGGIGVSEPLLLVIGLVLLLCVGWGVWKIAKLVWMAFSG